jgi:hypothetical protein
LVGKELEMSGTNLQESWQELGRATDQSSINTYVQTYPTAAVFSNKSSLAKQVPYGAPHNLRLRFLLRNDTTSADGADAKVTFWAWDANSGAMDCFVADLVAGASAVLIHPTEPNETFTATYFWAYADTITVGTDNVDTDVVGTADGIAEIAFDLYDRAWILPDFDCNASTAGTKRAADVICIGKYF